MTILGSAKEPHRRVRAEGLLVLEDRLQRAEGPAEALPHQALAR